MGGALRVTIIIKATFGLIPEGNARLVAPLLIAREDRHREGGVSLEEASEVAPYLPSTGVILAGHAQAPPGHQASSMSVRLGIFRDRWLLDKTLQVVGYRAPGGTGGPRPFQRIPLIYDRAFGGAGVEDNPIGVGASPGALPNIIDPAAPRR